MTKGGNRHTKKPEVDVGLLLNVFTEHSSLVADLGPYEHIGRSQSCHPKGLLKVLPLTKGLLQLSDTGEVHSQSLRSALMNLLLAKPSLSSTIYNGAVWCGTRVERVGVILFHMRTLKFGSEMKIAAAHLTGSELQMLQEVVDMIAKKPEVEEAPLPLEKRESIAEPNEDKKKLKKEDSEVSVDSSGFPKCFNTPEAKESLTKGCVEHSLAKGDASAASPPSLTTGEEQGLAEPSFLRRRPGHMASKCAKDETLQEELGFGTMKRPASSTAPKKTTKKPAGSLTKGPAAGPLTKGKPSASSEESLSKGSSKRKPWTRLTWVQTKKAPWRAYICGSHKPNAKSADCKLIVETAKNRSLKYLQILEKIYSKLEQEHYTKQEALDMRVELEGSM